MLKFSEHANARVLSLWLHEACVYINLCVHSSIVLNFCIEYDIYLVIFGHFSTFFEKKN